MFFKSLFKPKKEITGPGPECIIDESLEKALLYKRLQVKNSTTVNLGYDDAGNPIIVDIDDAPHFLIAGETKSGKSVCINNIIIQLLYKCSPVDGLHLYIADVKDVDYALYEFYKLPHLKRYTRKPAEILAMLQEIADYMDDMLSTCREHLVMEINDLPYKVAHKLIIFDEYSSIEKCPEKKDIIRLTEYIARKGRAAGIHLIIGTQSPTTSNGEITSTVKNNLGTRIAFKVGSKQASLNILGTGKVDASEINERGRGILKFTGMPLTGFKGVYVSKQQIKAIVDHWHRQYER